MFCLRISCYKLYKKGLFSYILTFKYMCHFEMSFKKFNLIAKHKLKNKKTYGYFFEFLVLCFPTYLPT